MQNESVGKFFEKFCNFPRRNDTFICDFGEVSLEYMRSSLVLRKDLL